jgi:hypothetical protein
MATIAALFAAPGRAEGALQALMTAGLSGHRTALIRPEVHATEMTPFRDPAASGDVRPGALAGVPAEDRAAFEAGLRRGGSVLVAEIAGDLQEAIRIVETFEPADLDGRTEEAQRRQGGGVGIGGGVDVGAPLGAGLTAGMGQGNTNLESVPGAGTLADDTSSLGTADLRTDEMSTGEQGRSAVPAAARRSEERAGAPGVRELGGRRQGSGGGRVRSYGA